MPRIRAIFGVIEQCLEERWLHTFEVAFGFADDVSRDKLRGVLKHMNEAMEFAQDVVWDMA